MKRIFRYIEPLWTGHDNKISLRRCLAIIFSVNLICNISVTLLSMSKGISIAEVTMLLGVEAGLIAALLSLTTYSNIAKQV
jgi:hypothetical protein